MKGGLDLDALVSSLSEISGVVAVALGGSRASGFAHSASDWDFCVYYRERLDMSAIRDLGFPGDVFEPSEWGPLLNGGAWLRVDDEQVDLLYRDLDTVERSIRDANVGLFRIEEAQGYVAGLPSYFLAGEVALGKVYLGSLPAASFTDALRRSAPSRWYDIADFSLWEADFCARRADPVTCAGMLAKAAIAVAQARLAERGEWVFNEKGILARAGISGAGSVLAEGTGATAAEMEQAVSAMRVVLGRKTGA